MLHVRHVHVANLLWLDADLGGDVAVGILHLALALPEHRVELIAQDGVEPGPEPGARLEARAVGPGLEKGLLHEVVDIRGADEAM